MVDICHTKTLHQIKTHVRFLQPANLEDEAKTELEFNKKRLQEIRVTMQNMKHEICQCLSVLRKELGNEVDIPAMVRTGYGPRNHKRIQEIIILRLKLTAMKSKFLEPSHKMYYRGPFDPKKKFDLKMLPQKQENLYAEILEKEKLRLLEHDKPLEKLNMMMKDLRLMHKASVFRTENLKANLALTSSALQLKKLEAEENSKIIEYMISHQNLLKLMLNPETLKLDAGRLGGVADVKASDFYKYKTLFEESEKENSTFIGKIYSLVERLDANNKLLVEAERMCVNNRLQLEIMDNSSGPGRKANAPKHREENTDDETHSQLTYLSQENKKLRDFFLGTAISYKEDFHFFVIAVNNIMAAFIKRFDYLKMA